jgi:sulfatase modifying factor 1
MTIGRAISLAMAGIVLAASAEATPAPSTADRVKIAAFSIDRTEVTIGAFRRFREANGTKTAAERDGGGFEYAAGWTRRPGWTWTTPYGSPAKDDEPAVHISHAEAAAYCNFAGGRLPTSAEWRQAAYTETRPSPPDGFVTGRTYVYPVGDQPSGMNNSRQRHVPVATTKAGVNGLYDMGANVWEWVADRRGDQALTAGGSWWYGPEMARAEGAQWKAADFYAVYIGFRCAYD